MGIVMITEYLTCRCFVLTVIPRPIITNVVSLRLSGLYEGVCTGKP